MMPSVESVRMVNSGTEATMSALRLARAFTGRELLLKFKGNYHGHADSFLISAGSGAMTFGVPDSPGVTKATAKNTLMAPYNDLQAVEDLFAKTGDKIAAVIVEPVVGNMGVVLPQKGFLEGLRTITRKYGTLLIFDEVITGFRLSRGGAQQLFGITPDLTTMGKIIGGGLPVGAYGGRKEIMEKLSPTGPVYQAGTLSGNPLAMAAGLTALNILNDNPQIYKQLEQKAVKLAEGFRKNIAETNTPALVNQIGSMLTLFFNKGSQVTTFAEAAASDTEKFAEYFRLSLENGIYLAPSQFETGFISAAHTDDDIDYAIRANREALLKMKKI